MIADPTTREIELAPILMGAMTSAAELVLVSGGVGSGKSFMLAAYAAERASVPGTRVGLFRKHRSTLVNTTLKTLLQGDGDTPPILPYGSYVQNKNENTIRILGGGEIVYGGCDDPGKLGSYNFTDLAIDEVVELSKADYQQLTNRVRVKHAHAKGQTMGVCNPGPPSHYLVEIFGLGQGYEAIPSAAAFTMGTADNPHTTAEYKARVAEMLGPGSIAYRRFFLGEWAGADGVVYDQWVRDRHAVDAEPVVRQVLGVDDGYTNPFVIVDMRVDGDGRAHVHRTIYRSRMQVGEKVEAIRELHTDGCEAVLIDPSANDLIDAVRDAGMDARPANNEVEQGIRRVQQRLSRAGDGRPRLTVNPQCKDVVREFETYEWDAHRDGTLKDKPKKMHDHAMDAIRYAVAHLDGNTNVNVTPVGTTVTRVSNPDRGWVGV